MGRRVFYSFHYEPDSWRVSQVRQMGVLEGNQIVSSNDWEAVTGAGEAAIKKWIAEEMSGKSCLVVLIGKSTADRKWIDYEIKKAWNDGRGVVGVHIHNLKDRGELQTTKGANPFADFTLEGGKKKLASVVRTYDPPYATSTNVYAHIASNLPSWVEEAIEIRKSYKPD